jgi:hypothetical protein
VLALDCRCDEWLFNASLSRDWLSADSVSIVSIFNCLLLPTTKHPFAWLDT